MRFLAVDDAASLADTAARLVVERVTAHPTLALTVPTGATPRGLYQRLRAARAVGALDLSGASLFMLDEYVDLPGYPVGSFVAYLREHLGDLAFNSSTATHLLTPESAYDPTAYDRLLDEAGGLDLAIVGVGRNGHVGFNEPGATDDQRTRVVTLAQATLEANFPGRPAASRPTRAVTVGLADLRCARSVLVLAAGEGKGEVVRHLAEGRRLEDVPATHLVDHPDLMVVAEAALVPT
jgi:glucosamine-6-phosphate deaminase